MERRSNATPYMDDFCTAHCEVQYPGVYVRGTYSRLFARGDGPSCVRKAGEWPSLSTPHCVYPAKRARLLDAKAKERCDKAVPRPRNMTHAYQL